MAVRQVISYGQHALACIASERNTILVLDTASGAPLTSLTLPKGTRATAAPIVDAPHNRLFVLVRSDSGTGQGGALIAFDTGRGSPVHRATLADANVEALAYDGRTGRVFISGESQGEGLRGGVLHVFDAGPGGLLHTEQGFGDESFRLAVAGTAGYLFALDGAGRTVLVANAATGKRLLSPCASSRTCWGSTRTAASSTSPTTPATSG